MHQFDVSPQSVVVVEDDADIASVLEDYLRFHGYGVQLVGNGLTAIDLILRTSPDMVLLDVMLPGCDGFEVLKTVRAHTQVPVIMLTARVEEVDRLQGLDSGADDYLCKPFSPREVVSRVRAVLRRGGHRAGPAVAGPSLVVDVEARRAVLRGRLLPLTGTEFDILKVLYSRPGRVYSRTQLLELVYPQDWETQERVVDSHVKNLRRKLRQLDPGHDWIRSVYGVGFSLEMGIALDGGDP